MDLSIILNLSGEELYQKALSFKEKEKEDYDHTNYTNYIIHIVMSANYNYDKAIQDLYDEYGNLDLYSSQRGDISIPFYKATKEFSHSANYLGYLYRYGYSMSRNYNGKKNYDKAFKYFEYASKDNSYAMVNLSRMFFEGKGVTIDLQKSKELLKKAIKLGNVVAMRGLCEIYEKNPLKLNKMIHLYELAVLKDDRISMYKLGKIYESNKDYTKAICLYEQAIKKNSEDAAYALANIYYNGFSGEVDLVKARELNELAIFTDYGDNTYVHDNIDQLEAIYDQDPNLDIKSMIKFAKMYSQIISHNSHYQIANAEKWYKKAIEKGSIKAVINLADLYNRNGYTDPIAVTDVRDLYESIIVDISSKYYDRALYGLKELYNKNYILQSDEKYTINYFFKIGKPEILKSIYNYNDDHMSFLEGYVGLNDENVKLKKENEYLRAHIMAQPDGPIFFEAMASYAKNEHKI